MGIFQGGGLGIKFNFMRGQIPVACLVLALGSLQTTGGLQELVYRGILRSETEPLVIGMLGTLAGVLIVAAGVALLIRSPLLMTLAQATAYFSVPVAILAGVIKHYAGWPMTVVGIALPIFLLFYCQKIAKADGLLSKA
jgi:hypothetical protein